MRRQVRRSKGFRSSVIRELWESVPPCASNEGANSRVVFHVQWSYEESPSFLFHEGLARLPITESPSCSLVLIGAYCG